MDDDILILIDIWMMDGYIGIEGLAKEDQLGMQIIIKHNKALFI